MTAWAPERDSGHQLPGLPSRACSALHQVWPCCSRASERGRWMPQCAQRTIGSLGTGAFFEPDGREAACGFLRWAARAPAMRAIISTARITSTQKRILPMFAQPRCRITSRTKRLPV
ncbi:hypothetical protein CEK29_20555 [Bordetella genomosp. 5]|nr:hypothetical protein CEK29_20555 [Bordetella genomosp. 5]